MMAIERDARANITRLHLSLDFEIGPQETCTGTIRDLLGVLSGLVQDAPYLLARVSGAVDDLADQDEARVVPGGAS